MDQNLMILELELLPLIGSSLLNSDNIPRILIILHLIKQIGQRIRDLMNASAFQGYICMCIHR